MAIESLKKENNAFSLGNIRSYNTYFDKQTNLYENKKLLVRNALINNISKNSISLDITISVLENLFINTDKFILTVEELKALKNMYDTNYKESDLEILLLICLIIHGYDYVENILSNFNNAEVDEMECILSGVIQRASILDNQLIESNYFENIINEYDYQMYRKKSLVKLNKSVNIN